MSIIHDDQCYHCGKRETDKNAQELMGKPCNCHSFQATKAAAKKVWNTRYSIFPDLAFVGSYDDVELRKCPHCGAKDKDAIELRMDGKYAYKYYCNVCGYNK